MQIKSKVSTVKVRALFGKSRDSENWNGDIEEDLKEAEGLESLSPPESSLPVEAILLPLSHSPSHHEMDVV